MAKTGSGNWARPLERTAGAALQQRWHDFFSDTVVRSSTDFPPPRATRRWKVPDRSSSLFGRYCMRVPFRLAAVAACVATCFAANASAATTAIHCGQLIDTQAGKLLGETTVVIDDKRIVSVAAGHHVPAGATEIDLSTQTCLPGLIDSHTHLSGQTSPTQYTDQFRWNTADYVIRSTVYARTTLLAGFTTVRNVGDNVNETIALRNAVAAGIVPGPRIFSAGMAIGSTGGHADPTDGYRADLAADHGPHDGIINGADDAWKAVRQHYKDGADLIKIMPSGGVLDESKSADNAQMTLEESRPSSPPRTTTA